MVTVATPLQQATVSGSQADHEPVDCSSDCHVGWRVMRTHVRHNVGHVRGGVGGNAFFFLQHTCLQSGTSRCIRQRALECCTCQKLPSYFRCLMVSLKKKVMCVFLRVVFSAVQTRHPVCCPTIQMYFHAVAAAVRDTRAVCPAARCTTCWPDTLGQRPR